MTLLLPALVAMVTQAAMARVITLPRGHGRPAALPTHRQAGEALGQHVLPVGVQRAAETVHLAVGRNGRNGRLDGLLRRGGVGVVPVDLDRQARAVVVVAVGAAMLTALHLPNDRGHGVKNRCRQTQVWQRASLFVVLQPVAHTYQPACVADKMGPTAAGACFNLLQGLS